MRLVIGTDIKKNLEVDPDKLCAFSTIFAYIYGLSLFLDD